MEWEWEREKKPFAGQPCVVLLKKGSVMFAEAYLGEWRMANSNTWLGYGDYAVVGWVSFKDAPLEILTKEQLIDLLRNGEAKLC